MAALDAGVANLERFIAYVAASTGALEKSSGFFDDSRDRFGDLEGEAGDEGGGLNDQLEQLGATLDSGLHDAEEALTALTQAALKGASVAAEAGRQVHEVSLDVQEQAGKAVDLVSDAEALLASRGFDELGRTLAHARSELAIQAGERAQASDELEAAVSASEAEAEAAWGAAEAEIDDAISGTTEASSDFEAATGESVQGFEAAAAEFEQRCSALASEVDVIYDALDATVAQEGQEWDDAVRSLVAEAVGLVERGAQQVDQSAGLVEEEALGALEREYAALGDILESAEPVAGELHPLAPDLVRSRQVIGSIDELLNALAG